MSAQNLPRVRVAAPPEEARKLVARLNRGGIAAAPDDGGAAEVLITVGTTDLAPFRARAQVLLAVGQPGAQLFAAGADEVVVPKEPETLFRRLRAIIERLDLQAKVERLGQRVAALEDGLADAAHDIRSPLHTAMGHAELFAAEESLSARQRQSAAAVVRQVERALQVAGQILDGARNQSRDALEPNRIDLADLIASAVESARSEAKARHVTLMAAPPARPVEIRADDRMLGRLLDNLLANALRAAPRGGEVELSVWRASPKLVRFCVRDTGPGVAAAQLAKLAAGLGPGRGLRICREIVDRHGGDLWAESAPGQGTRFFVELPISFPATRPRVLVVSDDGRWVREVARSLRDACDVRRSTLSAARLSGGRTDLVLVEATGSKGRSRSLDALRDAAKGAQVPVIELPSQVAAARLARTLAYLTA